MKKFIACFFLFQINLAVCHSQVIWSIGQKDNSAAEFALAPNSYKDFLKNDFGWEDKYFLIGYSIPKTDWPYILPGPADTWAGTSYVAGIRTHVNNILFNLKNVTPQSNFKLVIDVTDAQAQKPPLVKVTVNGVVFRQLLKGGKSGKSLAGDYSEGAHQRIAIPLNPGILKNGSNEVNITSIEGSWMVFDAVRLEGNTGPVLAELHPAAYIRNVSAAGYQTNLRNAALLIDVEHLSGTPILDVFIDGRQTYSHHLEKGRQVLESPVGQVLQPVNRGYEIRINGEIIDSGRVTFFPHEKITPAGYVNTHIGTGHSRWMLAPGPWMPFSMVKLSPDNQNSGWQAGYDPSIESIGTFSHVHEWTMAGLGIMPVNGPLKTKIGDQSQINKDTSGYRSAIDKTTEVTQLGYYKAHLTDYNINAELTSTTRCSFMKYTFPQNKEARVMIDLAIPAEYAFDIFHASLKQVNDTTIEGFSTQQSKKLYSHDTQQDYTIYFRIEFDRPMKKFGGWKDGLLSEGAAVTGDSVKSIGCFATFDVAANPVVQVRTGISFVSVDGAAKNLQQEVTGPFGWDFNAIKVANVNAWNEILSRIKIETDDLREKTRFYTNLYRAFCRNTFSDVDGRWPDATEKIQQLKHRDDLALGCDAFWNSFWNLNQLWNLAAPDWSNRWVRSQLAMYDANGWLAKGPAGMEYIPVMVGEHEIPLLVSAYQMGIRDYNVQKLFTAVKKTATSMPERIGGGLAGNLKLAAFLKHGYVPVDSGRFANTLEYAYDNWTAGQLALALNKKNDYKLFSERGDWWKNAIDPETGYARMRYADGRWEENFDPFKSGTTGSNKQYVEANGWQMTYFVPQDIPGLIKRIGRDRFLNRLTDGFKASETCRFNAAGDRFWEFPVVQGNQQSMHFAFLFNWAGEPWQTQHWSRSIMERYYGYGTSDAYPGDEDQGQMSAWFVMAALGLFQTDGGCSVEPQYEIASPLYERVTIDLGKKFGRGKQFTIIAKKNSVNNKYVQSAKLNGKPLNSFLFPAKELLKGGTLELQMGAAPNKKWGTTFPKSKTIR